MNFDKFLFCAYSGEIVQGCVPVATGSVTDSRRTGRRCGFQAEGVVCCADPKRSKGCCVEFGVKYWDTYNTLSYNKFDVYVYSSIKMCKLQSLHN